MKYIGENVMCMDKDREEKRDTGDSNRQTIKPEKQIARQAINQTRRQTASQADRQTNIQSTGQTD